MSLEEFEYELIELRKDKDSRSISKINEVYFFWKSFWTQVLNESDAPLPHWSDEFYRHDAAGVIFQNGVPVAVHLYGVQNLKMAACRGQTYFHEGFDNRFCSKLIKAGYDKAMSAAWLTINPDFVKNPERIVFSRCLMAIALKASDYLGCETVIGPTRSDNGIAAKIIEWGAVSYGQGRAKNTPVEMLVMDNGVQIPLPEIEEELVNQIWNHNNAVIKKAA